MNFLKGSVAGLAMIAGSFATAHASDLSGTLKIFSDMSNPAPRAVMEKMAADFDALHPDLSVELTIIDREAYKTQIRNFLTANAPDVATWYAANRMRPYVNAGLFEDVSDLWAEPEIADNLASTKSAVTIAGKQFGVPYTYYQVGLYYREDIHKELGLDEPADWATFKDNCQKIIDSGRKCFTIGNKVS